MASSPDKPFITFTPRPVRRRFARAYARARVGP
jgi:hypothetical protein